MDIFFRCFFFFSFFLFTVICKDRNEKKKEEEDQNKFCVACSLFSKNTKIYAVSQTQTSKITTEYLCKSEIHKNL